MLGPISYTYEELLAHKAAGVPGEALEKLRRDADKILEKPPVNVTMLKMKSPSGDIHDYRSMGPYWWPNPDTPDGLPYVNRDGHVNPDSRDSFSGGTVNGSILTLAIAAFYLGDKKYSEYAERQLYDWFLNPETRMNPNARHAQAIPGICDGRGVGLVGFSSTGSYLFDGIGILEKLGAIKEETVAGVREWYRQFTDWILTHEQGLASGNDIDNHACWHDAHILGAALFTDRPMLAKRICMRNYHDITRTHVRADGAVYQELRRTKAIGYSFYALGGILFVAGIAEKRGYKEYWSVDEDKGVCLLKKSADFLYPYVKNPASFPFTELYPGTHESSMAELLLIVDKRFPGEGYKEKAEEFNYKAARFNLVPLK